jgi:RNA ligase
LFFNTKTLDYWFCSQTFVALVPLSIFTPKNQIETFFFPTVLSGFKIQHKMESLKYPRTYHFPFSPGTTSDDRIKHVWQGILQHELVVTEKLDGENTCIKSDGVYARSHAAPTRNPWAKNAWDIWERIKLNLKDFDVFGENLYGQHSIEYTRLNIISTFLRFGKVINGFLGMKLYFTPMSWNCPPCLSSSEVFLRKKKL